MDTEIRSSTGAILKKLNLNNHRTLISLFFDRVVSYLANGMKA